MDDLNNPVVAFPQLPQDTQKKILDISKYYGYQELILDWNGTPGDNNLLINGIKASDKRFSLDTVPAFVINTKDDVRICNFILSNIADDFKIEIRDKNPELDADGKNIIKSLTPLDIITTDLYQFPIITDDELAKLTTNSFVRKMVNDGVLGRNKLIELFKPKTITKYEEDSEFVISITNNGELIEFSIVFKNMDAKGIYLKTKAGSDHITFYTISKSALDNIVGVPYKAFTVSPSYTYSSLKNEFNPKTEQELKITANVLCNKQLLKIEKYGYGDTSADGYDETTADNDGLSLINACCLRTERLPNGTDDWMNNKLRETLSLVQTMSLKAFSFPVLEFITGSYSRWNNNTNEPFPVILDTALVKPYLGTMKAAIDNNQIYISDDEDDTGEGTFTWEAELKYPDLSEVIKVYPDTDFLTTLPTVKTSSPNDKVSLDIQPIEIDGVKTGKLKTVTHYEKEEVDTVIPIDLEIEWGFFNYKETINIGPRDASGTIFFKQGNQISLMKGKTAEFTFSGTKAASVKFEVNSQDLKGVKIETELDQKGILPNELGEKYYSNFTGKAKVTTDDTASVTNYQFNCELLNSDGSITGTQTYIVVITKPLAEPKVVSTPTLQVNKDIKTTLTVRCSQTYKAELINGDSLKYSTVEMEKITHSDDLNDSETYDEYSFNLVFTPKGKVGNEELTLLLTDKNNEVNVNINLMVNVYDPIYSPIEKFMERLDGLAGHNVKFSYTEKKGYILPAAFVNNGEEVASILVAKYPLSQEAIDGKNTTEIVNNLSKPYRSRVRLYKNSKVKDNTGTEGGELHKLVMPHAIDDVLLNIKNSDLLNNRAYVVSNSAALDSMLANMSDASFIAKMYNGDLSNNINYTLEHKPIDTTAETGDKYLSNIKPDNIGYDLALTVSRTNDQSYSTVDEVKDVLYSNGAIWNSGKVNYIITTEGLSRLTSTKRLGEMQSPVYDSLDKTRTLAFPITLNGNTHNGEANGIVDAFGSGIKVYTDLVYENMNGEDKIKILDPYTTQVDYNADTYTTLENSFVSIPYNANAFMSNTDTVHYIGTNENKIDTGMIRSVFSNYDYDNFKYGYLMDSVGLPMDNSVLDYPDDITFKGNAGYSSVPNFQYGRSTYYVDYKNIVNNNGTKGYFVSGTVGNDRLVFGNRDEIHTDTLDWVNLYKGKKNVFDGKNNLGYGPVSAGNRSRILLHQDVLYGLNKKLGFTNDNVYYNNRLHFFIYDLDRVDRNPLVKLKVNNKFIELEETKSTTLDVVTDGTLTIGTYDKIGLAIDQNTNKITGLVAGEYSFVVKSEATGKDTAYSNVYVKVKDLLPMTILTTDVEELIGKTDDTKTITVRTNADDISTVITSTHAEIVFKNLDYNDQGLNVFIITIKMNAVTNPETSIIISGTAANSKTASIELPIIIARRIPTKYEVLTKNFSVQTKAELQGTLNTNYLAKKLGLDKDGINLTSTKQLTIWSQQLAGQTWKVNNDYTFGIDFGNSNYNTYIMNYEAQLDQEYEFNGVITAEKPATKVSPNLNSTVSGTITINVLTTN